MNSPPDTKSNMNEFLQRKSMRLAGYSYANPGWYFVTICTNGKQCLLGRIQDGRLLPTKAGEICHAVWQQLPARFANLQLDAFVVMPNHMHGIVQLMPLGNLEPTAEERHSTLSAVIGQYKNLVFREYYRWIKAENNDLTAKFWQRSFYDRVIRNERSLERIRAYIANNPNQWNNDSWYMEG